MQEDRFDSAVSVLSERMIQRLDRIPKRIKEKATEIRLRTGLPLIIMTANEPVFVLKSGEITYENRSGCYLVTEDDLQKSFRKICGYSIHSYQNEIKNGYLTLNGNRVGFCGTAVTEDGKITAVRKITSINVRVARQIRGVADEVVRLFEDRNCGGVLIAGAPSTGKTTLLKDLIRQLANGSTGKYWRISVVDERGELGGDREQEGGIDIGCSVDVFSGYPKGKGMEIAVRTMSPEILVCDEIGNREDVEAVRYCVNSGVTMIATIHAENREALFRKPFIPELLVTGGFQHFVFLDSRLKKCKIAEIYSENRCLDQVSEEEVKRDVEDMRDRIDYSGFVINRGASVL